MDKWGSTYTFVDFDYNDEIERNSTSSAYWEITRMFNIPLIKDLNAGIQYNDGLNTFGGFGNVWLIGIGYPINLKFITLNTSLWLRDSETQNPNFQTTIVWFKPFLKSKIIFNGFIDIWGQENTDGWNYENDSWISDEQENDSQIVILTEPQLWYNITERIAIGSEIEISKNFIFAGGEDWYVNPTIALKWDF